MTAEIINIILMASLFFLLGCILYVGYKLDETNDKLNKLEEFVYGMDIIQSQIIERICKEDKEVEK